MYNEKAVDNIILSKTLTKEEAVFLYGMFKLKGELPLAIQEMENLLADVYPVDILAFTSMDRHLELSSRILGKVEGLE